MLKYKSVQDRQLLIEELFADLEKRLTGKNQESDRVEKFNNVNQDIPTSHKNNQETVKRLPRGKLAQNNYTSNNKTAAVVNSIQDSNQDMPDNSEIDQGDDFETEGLNKYEILLKKLEIQKQKLLQGIQKLDGIINQIP